MDKVKAELRVSERRACAVLRQPRSTQRKPARGRDDELALTADIVELAKAYGRYGYRRITALLRHAGWAVNAKRVQRIWRREGLKVPQKQPKRSRLWLNDGSCVRLRAEGPNHVWSYDFVEDRTHVSTPEQDCIAFRSKDASMMPTRMPSSMGLFGARQVGVGSSLGSSTFWRRERRLLWLSL